MAAGVSSPKQENAADDFAEAGGFSISERADILRAELVC